MRASPRRRSSGRTHGRFGKVAGLGRMTVVYRLDRRPERTSAAFVDVQSAWITGGGGSWEYEAVDGGPAGSRPTRSN